MRCPDCHAVFTGKSCPECSWTLGKGEQGRQSPLGNHDPIVQHQCAYRTGDFRCRWGKHAPRKQETVYCQFHRHIVGSGMVSTKDQFQFLQEERAFMQATYAFESFLSLDDLRRYGSARVANGRRVDEDAGRLAVGCVPFWYRPLEDQWQALTGLPLPVLEAIGA